MTTAYESGKVPEILRHHRLRIAREEAGLEQGQLAELIGVSRNTIGAAEKKDGNPRRIVINAWALACGVPVSWLETGNAESPRPDGDPDGGLTVRHQGFEPRTR
ncbi:hypothetical protein CH302_19545 [Rhodococcus sp. 15-2388-1-1a]|uniref:helix-turn-helix transcriptional regulator n=1 Tax=Nocardiaceae TaxID=85025 RepID=UPI000B9BDDA2|nr:MULTISPECIES: helix-turn-helix transcriptional regulator [Rhodococcus]OZE95136.1 hypothetical protein CH302_19545 [Rhodococcus sp. 15-2388-1-1a]